MITCLGLSPALDVTYLLDRVEIGAIHRPREVIRLAGGKAFNVARAVDTLGARVRVIAPLGGDVGRLVLRGDDLVAFSGPTRASDATLPPARAQDLDRLT